ISNNNIYDFFGAGVTHSGIYLNGSNSGWTITGNRFYQTATRTITAGIQASAIWIIGSSSGYTISNNIIGYSSAAGTGTYTYGGSSASADFIPVYLQVGDGTNTFSGNTVTAISASAGFGGTGSSSPLKILFVTTSASNADMVISDNTLGSITTAGAIALNTTSSTTMDVFGIYLNAIKTATLSNNKIGGISVTIPSNSATKIIAVYLNNTNGTFTCEGNTITYRMNAELVRWPADSFYSGKLRPAQRNAQRRLALPQTPGNFANVLDPAEPLVFVEMDHQHSKRSSNEEAALVANLIEELIRCGFSLAHIAVVVPFRRQARSIRSFLKAKKMMEGQDLSPVVSETRCWGESSVWLADELQPPIKNPLALIPSSRSEIFMVVLAYLLNWPT
ncbi:MAG: hypothetical protein EOP50_18065, partial [Sphingobacteriales bacterium]